MWSRIAGQGTCYTFHITVTVVVHPPYRRSPSGSPTPFDGRVPLKVDISRRGWGRLCSPVFHGVGGGSSVFHGIGSSGIFVVGVVPHFGCTPYSCHPAGTTAHGGVTGGAAVILTPRGTGGHHHFCITVAPVVAHASTARGGMKALATPIQTSVIGVVGHGPVHTSLHTPAPGGGESVRTWRRRKTTLAWNLWKPSFWGARGRGSGGTGVTSGVHGTPAGGQLATPPGRQKRIWRPGLYFQMFLKTWFLRCSHFLTHPWWNQPRIISFKKYGLVGR